MLKSNDDENTIIFIKTEPELIIEADTSDDEDGSDDDEDDDDNEDVKIYTNSKVAI